MGQIMVLAYLVGSKMFINDNEIKMKLFFGAFVVKDVISLEIHRVVPIAKVHCIQGQIHT